MQRRTNEWYQGLRAMSSDEEEVIPPGASVMVGMDVMETSLRERHSPPSSCSGGSVDITDNKSTLPS